MPFHRRKQHRRSIRLKDYDYALAGAYFVTLCAQDRNWLFGDLVSGEVQLSPIGAIVREEWLRTPARRSLVILDAFVIMPNHLHGILVLRDQESGEAQASPSVDPGAQATRRNVPTTSIGPSRDSIGAILGQFKSITTKRVRRQVDAGLGSIWQRNYYEHVIRGSDSLQRIRQYIHDNPARWANDHENPGTPPRAVV